MTVSGVFSAIGLLYMIGKQAEAMVATIQTNANDQWFKDSADVTNKLQTAQSAQELQDASKALAHLISGL